MRRSHLAAGLAMAALLGSHHLGEPERFLGPRYPTPAKPKSKHKRKFKGSKAARKSSRQPKI